MQLPAPQLTEVLTVCPDLKVPLQDHLNTFTEPQRLHVPSEVQEIILGKLNAASSSLKPSPSLSAAPEPNQVKIFVLSSLEKQNNFESCSHITPPLNL